MNINTHTNFAANRTYRRPSLVAQQPVAQSECQDQVTLSADPFAKTRKTMGGIAAGGLFSGLLGTLPVSLMPAFGVSAATAGKVLLGIAATGAVVGGFSSATMPAGKDWY